MIGFVGLLLLIQGFYSALKRSMVRRVIPADEAPLLDNTYNSRFSSVNSSYGISCKIWFLAEIWHIQTILLLSLLGLKPNHSLPAKNMVNAVTGIIKFTIVANLQVD